MVLSLAGHVVNISDSRTPLERLVASYLVLLRGAEEGRVDAFIALELEAMRLDIQWGDVEGTALHIANTAPRRALDLVEANPKVRTCRLCACTNDDPCPAGCSWVHDAIGDLCSACLDRVRRIVCRLRKDQIVSAHDQSLVDRWANIWRRPAAQLAVVAQTPDQVA